MKKKFLLLLICFVFLNCKNDNKTKSLEKGIVNKEIVKNIISIDENGFEDFDSFFNQFNSDSIFQISRIEFPIYVIELNSEELIEEKIKLNKKDYYFQNFVNNSPDYTLEKQVTNSKATVSLKGIENGIFMEIFFENKNGGWYLLTWNNFST